MFSEKHCDPPTLDRTKATRLNSICATCILCVEKGVLKRHFSDETTKLAHKFQGTPVFRKLTLNTS